MTPTLHPAAAASLAKWHDMVTAQDLGGLRAITHPDAVFRSPVAHKAYHSAEAVVLAVRLLRLRLPPRSHHGRAGVQRQGRRQEGQGHRLHPL